MIEKWHSLEDVNTSKACTTYTYNEDLFMKKMSAKWYYDASVGADVYYL